MEKTDKRLMELETPCFIFEAEELKRSVNGFKSALKKNFAKSVVGYSVKTNSTPYCMHSAMTMGAYAEVVSYDEYKLALLCGFPKERLIYNGPMKSRDTFFDAIKHHAIVNIETKRELKWLRELDKFNEIYNIGLRLNINITNVSPRDSDGDNDNSRFGFSDETGEFADAIDIIKKMSNIRLNGLHIHRTTHSRSVGFYEHSVRYACSIIRKYNLQIDYLDVGGGYYGIFPNKPTYQQYSDVIYKTLQEEGLSNVCVVVEPGNALVASCFSFLSEVIDIKQVEKDRWFITTDGSRNDIDPFYKKQSYLEEELYLHTSKLVESQIISGCTCLEYDRMFELHGKPLLNVGDRILYHNVGAYTMCLTPMFIRYVPKIYAFDDKEGVKLIRQKWSVNEFVQKTAIK